jgi:glycopeptide antibiotics resistance protein
VPGRATQPGSRAARLTLVLLLVVVAFLVLGPLPVDLFRTTVRATRDVVDLLGFNGQAIDKLDVEKACNVLVAVPVGFLLAKGWPAVDPRLWLVAALVGSFSVEVGQTALLPGRYGTVLDVVLNTTGAAIGLLAAHGVRGRGAPRPADAERSS